MSEQYRFMRYYLPGALFLGYLIILVVLNLSSTTINSLNWDKVAGVFLGALGASPVVGYLIYAVYNELIYERLAKEDRPALQYIEHLSKGKLESFPQKKEFLDLIYHSTLVNSGKEKLQIDPEILNTLKGHLSNFAARYVCSTLVPFLMLLASPFTLVTLQSVFIVNYTFRPLVIFFYIIGFVSISIVLRYNCKRVLREAYQLEEYFIKAKEELVKELLEKEFPKK